MPQFRPAKEAPDSSERLLGTLRSNRTHSSLRRKVALWIWPFVAAVFLALTTVYASCPSATSRMGFLSKSSSNIIFVLSALSSLSGVLLGHVINFTFERVMWVLICSDNGLRLSSFLGLQASTGLLGLIALTIGKGHSCCSPTRIWSAVRLMAVLLIPAVGVLIMSNVNTQLTYEVLNSIATSTGWGMSSFNASLANNVSLLADNVLQAELAMFLSQPSRALDITPASIRSVPCMMGPTAHSTQPCQRTFFMPGGMEQAVSSGTFIANENLGEVFLAEDQLSYILSFVEAASDEDGNDDASQSHCQVYGFEFAAINLCLKNLKDNQVYASESTPRSLGKYTISIVLSQCG
jgi:hypothetical protein